MRQTAITAMLVAVLVAMLAARPSAQAGWKIVQEEQGPHGANTTTILIEGGALKVEPAMSPMHTIVNVDTDRLILINRSTKQYTEMQLSAFLQRMTAMLQAARELMKQLPLEMRKGIPNPAEAMEINLRATGKQGQVGGYKAVQFALLNNDGKKVGTVWLSKDGLMSQIHKDLVKFAKALDVGFNQSMKLILKTTAENGFPVKTAMTLGGRSRTTTLLDLRRARLTPDIFKAPRGYRKVKPEQMMGSHF